MNAPLPIKSLNHVGRLTRRLDESRAFYRDVLGFREVARPNFNFAGAWLENYGFLMHLIESDSAGNPDGEINTRDNHLAFHADDLNIVEARLAEHGVPFRRNVIPDRGIKQLFFQDPDGNHIEIGTYPSEVEYL